MRVIGTIDHPQMRISLFAMNDKYLIKFEAGPMEQTYKFPQTQVKGLEELQKLVDDDFCRRAMERFNEMYKDIQRLSPERT